MNLRKRVRAGLRLVDVHSEAVLELGDDEGLSSDCQEGDLLLQVGIQDELEAAEAEFSFEKVSFVFFIAENMEKFKNRAKGELTRHPRCSPSAASSTPARKTGD